MHELAITQNILDIALRHAEDANATVITDIYLVIGQLSSVVDDSVQFYWDIIAQDTIAEQATLHFERLPAELHCRDCNQTFPLTNDFTCPTCGGFNVTVVSGDQFTITAIDIETEGVTA